MLEKPPLISNLELIQHLKSVSLKQVKVQDSAHCAYYKRRKKPQKLPHPAYFHIFRRTTRSRLMRKSPHLKFSARPPNYTLDSRPSADPPPASPRTLALLSPAARPGPGGGKPHGISGLVVPRAARHGGAVGAGGSRCRAYPGRWRPD